MGTPLPNLTPLIAELRVAEPHARAFYLFGSVARALDDPQDLLSALRAEVMAARPPRITSANGLHYDLKTLLE